jgi:hypothetical protein
MPPHKSFGLSGILLPDLADALSLFRIPALL